MKQHPRKTFVAGVSLILAAVLVMLITALYVAFAPRVFSSEALVIVNFGPPKSRPARLNELPLQAFGEERNLTFEQATGTPLIRIKAFAADPKVAATRANDCVTKLAKLALAQMSAQLSIVANGAPNSRPVRPATQKILVISTVAALNLGLAGTTCLVIHFLKRRHIAAEHVSLAPT